MELAASHTGITGLGYQGVDIDAFAAQVVVTGTEIVADVRLTPVSRKRGFSKAGLSAALSAVGVQYRHLPALGNPKYNRAGFGGTAVEVQQARDHYWTLLEAPPAAEALGELAALAHDRRVAVLCFEADQSRCHRDLVLAALARFGQYTPSTEKTRGRFA